MTGPGPSNVSERVLQVLHIAYNKDVFFLLYFLKDTHRQRSWWSMV